MTSESPNHWENRRIVIAAFFLPVSTKTHTETTPVFHTAPIVRRTSFISSVKAERVQPLVQTPHILHPTDTKFYPSIVGNPGLYNAVGSLKETMGPTIWIGTVGTSTDHLSTNDKEVLERRLMREHNCSPVFLTKEELDGHYHRFCKQVC
jgi:trehalose-6-phosphate synthase